MSRSFCSLAMTSLLFLVSSCLGQDKGGVDQTVAMPAVHKILSSAHLSGSLEFWGLCDISKPRPDFLKLRPLSGHEGSTRAALAEMFANDPKMRVIQERDGKIRMVETDVPRDFLEIKIHHLAFSAGAHGPGMAVMNILHSQEVVDFMTAHNVVPKAGWGLPTDVIFIHKPSVIGELNEVTVAEALDYVLLTFPGFWIYQNCHDQDGRRSVLIGFRQNMETE